VYFIQMKNAVNVHVGWLGDRLQTENAAKGRSGKGSTKALNVFERFLT